MFKLLPICISLLKFKKVIDMAEEKKRKAVYNPEADRRWNEKNKEHRRYLSARGGARGFIRNRATEEDLDELEALIAQRRAVLKESK